MTTSRSAGPTQPDTDLTPRIEQDPDRWDRILGATRHDVSHTAGFQRFQARAEGGDAYLAVVGDAARGLAWPYVLRPVDRVAGLEGEADLDIGSFLGYVGPVSWGVDHDDPFLATAAERVIRSWRDQGAVTAFVRFHPLLDNAPQGVDAGDGGTMAVDTIGDTVSIDCTIDDEAAHAGYARVLRQEIAASRRAGVRTEHDDDWQHIGTFVRLYTAAMNRKVAPSEYRLDELEVRRLRDDLGPRLHLFVTRVGEDIIASGLFSEQMGIVEAHLAGVDDAYRRLSPLKVMLDDVRRWAHDRGDLVLHLGSGRGGRADSLFDFKRRFSPRRHPLRIGRWTIEPERQRALLDLRRRRLAERGLGRAEERWFPSYRSPIEPITSQSVAVPMTRQPSASPAPRASAAALSMTHSSSAMEAPR